MYLSCPNDLNIERMDREMQRSIREELLGTLHDFCKTAGFNSMNTNEVLAELVFHLSEYREEEVPLFPSLFLTEERSQALAAIAPAHERIPIGNCSIISVASNALKECAALACDGWAIYLVMAQQEAHYGLFRTVNSPFSVSALESLRDPQIELGPIVMIRNCSSRCVEMIDGKGNGLELSLSSSHPPKQPVSSKIGRLAAAFMADLCSDSKGVFPYVERLLGSICQQAHGTIIAVLPANLGSVPAGFQDGVMLEPPLDLGMTFQELDRLKSADALSRLYSRETLLRGMINSDGITLLSSDLKVIAFRVFVKPNVNESQNLEKVDIRGGARTRAFELLKLRLKDPLNAVFLRSQDGRTEFVEVHHE